MLHSIEDLHPEYDGLHHINIYSQGKTEIGRFYSNFAFTPIKLDEGIFNSIEAYWYWLVTGGKSPKNTHGWSAKSKGKAYPRVADISEDKIKKAIDTKMRTYLKFIIQNDDFKLPVYHYYVYQDIVKDPGYYWITDHTAMRRQQIKEWLEKKKPLS